MLKAWHCLKQCKRKAPSGWNNNNYWSATPSGSGHASVNLPTGHVFDSNDTINRFVAFEVLNGTTDALIAVGAETVIVRYQITQADYIAGGGV